MPVVENWSTQEQDGTISFKIRVGTEIKVDFEYKGDNIRLNTTITKLEHNEMFVAYESVQAQ